MLYHTLHIQYVQYVCMNQRVYKQVHSKQFNDTQNIMYVYNHKVRFSHYICNGEQADLQYNVVFIPSPLQHLHTVI